MVTDDDKDDDDDDDNDNDDRQFMIVQALRRSANEPKRKHPSHLDLRSLAKFSHICLHNMMCTEIHLFEILKCSGHNIYT